MSISDRDKTIALNITHFPLNLLVPGDDNVIRFQAINYFNKQAMFRFEFEGENLIITIPDELQRESVEFGPGETRVFEIKLNPTLDGFGKLTFSVNWLKIVEYTVKVKKVRTKVPKSKINKILKKQTLMVSKYTNDFHPETLIVSMKDNEIKRAEKDLESKKIEYQSVHLLKQNILTQVGNVKKGMSIEEIDGKKSNLHREIEELKKILAKGYLSNRDPFNALKYAMTLSDEKEQSDLYYNLIRAYATIDLDGSFQLIQNITNREKKNALIKNIAFDQLKKDPEKAPKVAYLIEDDSVRENLILDIIGKIIDTDHDLAIKISTVINDDLLKAKIFLYFVKLFHEQKNFSEMTELLNQIVKNIENSADLDLSDNHYKNPGYEIYRDVIHILAEVDSPQKADNLLTTFSLREVKDKVSEDLFDMIYEMVDEVRTKVDPSPVYSHYYLFNTSISNITNDIRNFSKIGGNISNNIINNDFNFNVLFLSLFSYDFSVFPILDRVYSDLKYNSNKSIAYYILPSREKHNQFELNTLTNSLRHFKLSNLSNQMFIFNLDFIPYLGKPTIIISSEPSNSQFLYSKINKILGGAVNIMIDNDIFEGGTSMDNLKQIFNPHNNKIANLVLSYEFINDYDIFKSFIQALI